MSERRDLLDFIIGSEDDYEWYPTTNEIIMALHKDMVESNVIYGGDHYAPGGSFLDIGAGDGKVLKQLKSYAKSIEDRKKSFVITDMYAIEKSQPLLSALPNEVYVIGTDFHESTLIDKEVTITFSNPPYRDFSQWSTKIIKEANSSIVYLVIPQRWEKDKLIKEALAYRNAETHIVGEFSFVDAEDRKARSNVHLVRVVLRKGRGYSSNYVDPFKAWFNDTYNFNTVDERNEHKADYTREREEREAKENSIKQELLKGGHLIERLEQLYSKELQKLHENYMAVGRLDKTILAELDVKVENITKGLREKIKGTKNLYWQELFDNLDKITSRLTRSSRKSLLNTLTHNTNVDFTSLNAYAVVIWAIKNANKYYDSQLLSLYKTLTCSDGIKLYKSNQRIIHDDWRYLKEEMTHYALDYRIVSVHSYAILGEDAFYGGGRTFDNGLGEDANYFLEDIVTIAKNLGFGVETHPSNLNWKSGKSNYIYMSRDERIPRKKGQKTHMGKIEEVYPLEAKYNQGHFQYKIDGQHYHEGFIKTDEDTLMEVKAYKNGNIHLKFNKRFIKALNINAARLNGWIKKPSDAVDEFDITLEEAEDMFGCNYTLLPSAMRNLLPSL